MKDADRPRAGIYTRISLAALGDTTKTGDQERICRELAARLGWDVAEVYCDHSKSAWQKNRKRKQWDRMLADVDRGHINAIVVYHGDRLVRRPQDLSKLLDLADNKGVKLASPTGTYDLDKNRLELWIRAAFAEEESQRTSERRQDQYKRWRREGRVRTGGRGGRAYGFAKDGLALVPPEVTIIQEAARRVLDGEPTLAIARDLTARGHRTPTGGPFTHGTLRKMLSRARYAGLMPDGVSPAAWQPVLDQATWEAVRGVLEAKAAGFGYATNARRWLLSGIACCGACGTPLAIKTENRAGKTPGYRCIQQNCRRVQRSAEHLDEYVITRTIARLGNPANPPGRVPENHMLARELRTLIIQRSGTAERIRDPSRGGQLDMLLDRLSAIDARLEQLRSLAAGNAQSKLLGAHTGITREQWNALPLTTRRALIAACYTVTVLPASKRGPGFNTADVRLAPSRHA
jgi:site-specific DNA recombinase